ncbi:MAG: hypothetical protein WAV05_17515 [Anaerolineales bacterium]
MPAKSIVQKLSIKAGRQFLLVNPPNGYLTRLGALPGVVKLLSEPDSAVEATQVFVVNRAELEAQHPRLETLSAPKGMLWFTDHKGSTRVKTDINREAINAYTQSLRLQGVAIISIVED